MQLYTTQNNRQIEKKLDIEDKEEATDRCIQYRTIKGQIERQIDSQIESLGWQLEFDVYNIKQQIDRLLDRQIDRQRGGESSYRQLDVYNIKQQIDREIVRY